MSKDKNEEIKNLGAAATEAVLSITYIAEQDGPIDLRGYEEIISVAKNLTSEEKREVNSFIKMVPEISSKIKAANQLHLAPYLEELRSFALGETDCNRLQEKTNETSPLIQMLAYKKLDENERERFKENYDGQADLGEVYAPLIASEIIEICGGGDKLDIEGYGKILGLMENLSKEETRQVVSQVALESKAMEKISEAKALYLDTHLEKLKEWGSYSVEVPEGEIQKVMESTPLPIHRKAYNLLSEKKQTVVDERLLEEAPEPDFANAVFLAVSSIRNIAKGKGVMDMERYERIAKVVKSVGEIEREEVNDQIKKEPKLFSKIKEANNTHLAPYLNELRGFIRGEIEFESLQSKAKETPRFIRDAAHKRLAETEKKAYEERVNIHAYSGDLGKASVVMSKIREEMEGKRIANIDTYIKVLVLTQELTENQKKELNNQMKAEPEIHTKINVANEKYVCPYLKELKAFVRGEIGISTLQAKAEGIQPYLVEVAQKRLTEAEQKTYKEKIARANRSVKRIEKNGKGMEIGE